MGIVEVLVHTHDITHGLAIDWVPPDTLCAPVLPRLFPAAPREILPRFFCGARDARHSAIVRV
jgi:hypothetical protein